MKKIIFVGGIHGVGKTSFCNELSSSHNLLHYSASKLIAQEKKEQFSKNKYIDNIDKNQDLLIEAINNYTPDNKWFLLDGHFCLLNKEGIITKVPEETFHIMRPQGIIVLKDCIENIVLKLRKRDGTDYDINLLQSFQKAELDYSRLISHELNIPLLIYNITDPKDALYSFINTVLHSYLEIKGENRK
ncbi:ATP-binding protein [Aneurinibacillus migulanus]|uniref:Adenylate kinase n=1 Tax=Aneurinibacillus migulanus TaxID=47500 RepID=A0A0D1XTT2_ANEMI|nr:ATP-binding protein [Aneurinibacillus migulanus]KIV55553.1 hypothetical protein TS65_14290 [Aneurinibacillus migulanus]KON95827.1 hypothetical protein AF333_10345 [Aneurinibacillus migulanus]MED0891902.1 AAA family ATPase [Aneurinibacillus migulanus]MED1617358.1 AAA family ATPase [Aneurinibacillus migulanus]MED4726832.1 AAA family ATPase [Aneurinibacillus migulanus]